jgi:hypothetical protein
VARSFLRCRFAEEPCLRHDSQRRANPNRAVFKRSVSEEQRKKSGLTINVGRLLHF